MRVFFKGLWSGWKELAHYIGDFQSRLLLTIFYFTVAVPFGVLVRLVIDPLRIHCESATSNWTKRQTDNIDLPAARRQF